MVWKLTYGMCAQVDDHPTRSPQKPMETFLPPGANGVNDPLSTQYVVPQHPEKISNRQKLAGLTKGIGLQETKWSFGGIARRY